ncbi:hypothetical protein QVD17_15808 [Tagetes erecta]|uniref:Cotton fiber protein n=1 Tax=Tagetes erecta TaxID=13708 RepID=A0AAD8NSZ5_TARER|nr:hypothetical protein QVD17_15808 [Tagetes erecta]
MQRSPSSSSSSYMKIKTLILNFIYCQLNRATHLLIKAKSLLIEIVEEAHLKHTQILVPLLFKKKRNKNKLYIGSFRFRYNSSRSHVVPQSSGFNDYVFYDHKWDSFDETVTLESELSGYLHWLEENDSDTQEIIEINEIDDLAEKFIANCHERFVLEKQESDRRFEEMMARSL